LSASNGSDADAQSWALAQVGKQEEMVPPPPLLPPPVVPDPEVPAPVVAPPLPDVAAVEAESVAAVVIAVVETPEDVPESSSPAQPTKARHNRGTSRGIRMPRP
jgi:hypothetical protein